MFGSAGHLPYIPPPDYTIRYKVPQKAPQKAPQHVPQKVKSIPIMNQPTKQQRLRDDHGKPHHYFPEIKKPFQKPRSLSTTLDEEPYEEPRDQSPQEVQRRVLRYLREQGVPIFPNIPLKEVVEHGNAALGPTRAYIKHLENHRKYDTLNSFRSCDTCALCKQMQNEIRILEKGIPKKQKPTPIKPYQPEPDYTQPHHHYKKSSGSRSEIISGRLFEPLQEVEVEEFPDEPEEIADLAVERKKNNEVPNKHQHNLSVETQNSNSSASSPEHRRRVIHVPEARAKRNFNAATEQQLSVKVDDKLKVIQTDAIWSLCIIKTGQMGWVPTNNLEFQHFSSLGSSRGSN